MAVAVDASSPARVIKSGTAAAAATTATFDPPAGVLLFCGSGDDIGHSFTVTNNGAALTWVEIGLRNSVDVGGNNGAAHMLYAVLSAGRTGMTVTGTYSIANDTSFKVYVLTGADTADVIGGVAEGSTTSATFNTTGYTSETVGLSFVTYNDYNPAGTPTSSDTTLDADTIATQISFASGYKTIASAGASVTHNLQAPGATLANWVAAEIRVAAAAGTSLRIPIQTIQVP